LNFSFWGNQKEKRSLLFNNKQEKRYFSSFLSDSLADRNNFSVWDAQYLFTLRLQSQLSIYPAVNLVTNIGLGNPNATHTTKKKEKHLIPALSISFPLKHPQYVLRNKKLDDATIRKLFFSWKRLVRYFLKMY
jgi:hypothetical protein